MKPEDVFRRGKEVIIGEINMPAAAAATPQDAMEDKKHHENLYTQIRTTGDGQKHHQGLHKKKRDRQNDRSEVQTSAKRSTSTTYMLRGEHEKKRRLRSEKFAGSKLQNKNELKQELYQGTVTEDNNAKDRFDAIEQQTNSDSDLSLTEAEPCDVHPADSEVVANKKKSMRPKIIDYAAALHRQTCVDVNLFETADLLKCITNVHPVDQRSELEREIGMFPRDWLTHHQDPSIQYLDIYLNTSCDRDMEKIFESAVYIEAQNLVKTFDDKAVGKLKNSIDMLPMTEEVFNYEMNWTVLEKYKLHEKMRPWISNIARNSLDEEADDLVSQILKSMKNHGSALSIREQIMSFCLVNEDESETLFQNMWARLFSEIKNLEKDVGKKPMVFEIFSDTPKTKEEVLLLEINWAIFDQHELHDMMRPWIREEVIKLLKKEKASEVDQVVSCIKKPNHPSQMVELLELSMDCAESIVRMLWRTLLILVKIFETGIPTEDNMGQPDPIWNSEESSDRVGGVIKRNRCYSYPSFWRQNRMLSFETLCEAYRLENVIPRNIEQLSSYDVNWAVSDRVELHDRLRPWILCEIMEFEMTDEAAIVVVESIVKGIKDHANAKDMLELVKPSLGESSAIFVLNLWVKLIFGIQLAGTPGLDTIPDIYRERLASGQYGGRYGRNRHFMMVAFDYENLCKLKQINETMPKTKEELFSYEINWDVYEKYGLQKKLQRGIWVETLELVRKRKDAMPVDEQIMWSTFDYHVSASRREFEAREEAIPVFDEIMSRLHNGRASPSKMLEYLEAQLGSRGSEKFLMRMWYAIICGIKLAEAGVSKKGEWGSLVLLRNQNL